MDENCKWDELLEFTDRVTRKVLREMHAQSEFEELRGTATLALCDCLERFDEQLGVAFRTFAYLRIRGAVLDELRRNLRRKKWELPDNGEDEVTHIASPLPSPLEHCERKSKRRLLEKLISRLSANERQVIRLLYFSERSPAEVSNLLDGKSKSWISRYHRDGLLSLKLLLSERTAADLCEAV